jgi:hypothetical protein
MGLVHFLQFVFRGNCLYRTLKRFQSLRLAQEWGNDAYRISANWLESPEREEHEMPLSTLLVLANIYNLPAEQLLRPIFPGSPHALNLLELSVRNSTSRFPTPDHTTVLPADNGISLARFGRGVIGKHDRTLDPIVPARFDCAYRHKRARHSHTKKLGRCVPSTDLFSSDAGCIRMWLV